jgi:hypothetical protein
MLSTPQAALHLECPAQLCSNHVKNVMVVVQSILDGVTANLSSLHANA